MVAEHEEQTRRALEEAEARLEAESEAKIANITEEANRRVEEMTALTASTRLAAITATAAALDQQQALEAGRSRRAQRVTIDAVQRDPLAGPRAELNCGQHPTALEQAGGGRERDQREGERQDITEPLEEDWRALDRLSGHDHGLLRSGKMM